VRSRGAKYFFSRLDIRYFCRSATHPLSAEPNRLGDSSQTCHSPLLFYQPQSLKWPTSSSKRLQRFSLVSRDPLPQVPGFSAVSFDAGLFGIATVKTELLVYIAAHLLTASASIGGYGRQQRPPSFLSRRRSQSRADHSAAARALRLRRTLLSLRSVWLPFNNLFEKCGRTRRRIF